MCTQYNSGSEAEPVKIYPRIQEETHERLEDYCEQHNLSKSAGVDKLLRIALGDGDTGKRVEELEAKLDTVLEALDAPTVGSPEQREQNRQLREEREGESGDVITDGAATQKVDYDNLTPEHTVSLEPDEADYSDKETVRCTQTARVPVMRGLMLERVDGVVPESEVTELAKDTFGCTHRTARSYVEWGHGRSWYRNPATVIEEDGVFEQLTEELEERGKAHRIERTDSLRDLLGRIRTDDGETQHIWSNEATVTLDERLQEARTRKLLTRLFEAACSSPGRAEYSLLYARVLAYARKHESVDAQLISEQLSELEAAGVEAPSRWWESSTLR